MSVMGHFRSWAPAPKADHGPQAEKRSASKSAKGGKPTLPKLVCGMSSHQKSVARKPPQGWSFTITEVSNGVYRVRGVGPGGVAIERHGTDDDALLFQLIENAEKLSM